MDGRAGVMMVLDGVRLAALWRASTAVAQAYSLSRLPRLLRRAKLALLPIPSNKHDLSFRLSHTQSAIIHTGHLRESPHILHSHVRRRYTSGAGGYRD